MNAKNRILAFLLALVLLFGTMSTAIFAVVPEEIEGGVITEEDVQNGSYDALTGNIPAAGGILSTDAIKNSGMTHAVNNADKLSANSHAPGKTWNPLGNVTEKTEGDRKFLQVGAPDADLLASNTLTVQIGQDLKPYSDANLSNLSTETSAKLKGQSFVVSVDIRLDEYFLSNIGTKRLNIINLYTYAYADTATTFPKSTKSIVPLYIDKNCKLIANTCSGSSSVDTGYVFTPSTMAEDGTVTAGNFATVAMHVKPKTNTYDIYVDGVRYASNLVFLSDADMQAIANVDAGKTYTKTGSTTTYNVTLDYSETDFMLGMARVLASWDANLKTLTGPFFSYDNLKLYYSDLYIECTEHKLAVGAHEHNDEALTSTGNVKCENCDAEWAVTVPMDQTGNLKCDLCEINNQNYEASSGIHSDDLITDGIEDNITVGSLLWNDGSTQFGNGPTQIDYPEEYGNKFFKIGETDAQFFNDLKNTEANSIAKIAAGIKTLPTVGKNFVASIDIRLGENFLEENQTFELIKLATYAAAKAKDDTSTPTSSMTTSLLGIDGQGNLLNARNNLAIICNLADVAKDKFVNIAVHVRLTGTNGEFDVYVDGELMCTSTLFSTKEIGRLETDYITADGVTVDLGGLSTYTLAFVRFLHTYSSAPVALPDVLHADNMIVYFADEFAGNVTTHSFVSEEHVHDYSKKTSTYGSYCALCGMGNGGVSILDANGDKICDICVNEQLDTKGAGIIAPDKIASTEGVEKVFVASGTKEASPFGFSSVQNTAGCVSATTEDGNTYVKICGKEKTDTGIESFLSINAYRKQILENFDTAGNAFVVSMDLRLHGELTLATTVFNLMSYMKDTTFQNSLQSGLVKLAADGTIQYRDGADGNMKSSGHKLTPGSEDFTTVAIHVRPKDGEFGLYTLYVDGVAVVSDIQFLTESENDTISWTIDGVTSTGAHDYVLGAIRSFPLYNGTVNQLKDGAVTDTMLSVDNPKLYYADNYVECAKHFYTASEHRHDIESNEIVIDAVCDCGKKEEIRLPIDTVGDGCCDTCGVYVLSGGAVVTARRVVLGDRIAMKLYAIINSTVAENPDNKVVITVGDVSEEIPINEFTPDEDGVYCFEAELSSIEMTTEISIALKVDGEIGDAYTTTVRDYAEELLKDKEQSDYTKNMVKTMLNFGAYAQEYFALKNGTPEIAADLANTALTDEEKSVASVNAADLSPYAVKSVTTAPDANIAAAKLILDTTTAIKVYVDAEGSFTATVNGEAASVMTDADGTYVRINGILPGALDTPYTVSVTTASGTATSEVSALSCVHAILSSDASEKFTNLARATYLYSLAAELYLATATESVAEVVVKNGAKGAAALVLDDGTEQAATFAARAMQKYTNIEVSFALITKNYATLTKDSDGYVMSEDGKYTYTQSSAQIRKSDYWTTTEPITDDTANELEAGVLNLLDENGVALRARIELISHSYTHGEPEDGDYYAELLGARHILWGIFGYDSEALITPGGFTKTAEYDATKMDVYIGCRGTSYNTNPDLMINTLDDFAPAKRGKLGSFMVGYNKMWLGEGAETYHTFGLTAEEALNADSAANGVADVSHVEAFIDSAMNNGGLAAFCFHKIVPSTYNGGVNGIKESETGKLLYGGTVKEGEWSLHTYEEQADAIFAYVEKHAAAGDLWSTTYSTAVKYFSEWYSSKLDVRVLDNGLIAVSLTDGEDDEMFDEALTVKIAVPDDWESTKLSTGEILEVKGDADAKYVLVNIVPDSGIVTLVEA